MKTVFFLISSFFICYNSFSQIEDVLIGTKKTVHTQVFRINNDWNGSSRINYEYTPPASWQIFSFKPIVISKKGSVFYKFSTIPSTFENKNAISIYAKFIELLEFASEKNVANEYDSVIIKMRNDYESYSNKTIKLYSKITATGSMIGSRKRSLKTKSCLYLDMEAVLIYMPDTENQLLQSLAYFKEIINSEE